MLQCVDYWTDMLDQGHSVDTIYMDFAKAFDSVPHERLLEKVKGYGIWGDILDWIRLFIKGRRQRVVVNGKKSTWLDVKSGVPQGSVIGPLLGFFLLFINGMPREMKCNIQVFADNANIFKTVDNEEDHQDLANDSDYLENWARLWHLVCCDCSCWIQFDTSGCTLPWAEMKGSTVFKCKGCTEVARLVGEVEELRKMMESLKRMVTGQGLEESSGETGDREATLEEAEEREKCVGEKTRDNSSTEESEGKKICSGTPILATHSYRKNQDSPLGNELDLQQGDTLSYILDHEDNEHWWLAEDSKGQVGYVPVSHLMIIMDETIQEEECDRTRKEVQGKSMDGAKIGGEKRQEGERRKKYSAAVIEGIKRNATTYVGDSIVRKTDARLNKGEDVVVCLPGARIEHVTERVEKIM